ncbi:MAG: hypothetical protein AAFP18_11025 [Bacteroidota bacterium]
MLDTNNEEDKFGSNGDMDEIVRSLQVDLANSRSPYTVENYRELSKKLDSGEVLYVGISLGKGKSVVNEIKLYFDRLVFAVEKARKSILVAEYQPSMDYINWNIKLGTIDKIPETEREKIVQDNIGAILRGYERYYNKIEEKLRNNKNMYYYRLHQVSTPHGEDEVYREGKVLYRSIDRSHDKMINHVANVWYDNLDTNRFRLYLTPVPVLKYSYMIIDGNTIVSELYRYNKDEVAVLNEMSIYNKSKNEQKVDRKIDMYLSVIRHRKNVGAKMWAETAERMVLRNQNRSEEIRLRLESLAESNEAVKNLLRIAA